MDDTLFFIQADTEAWYGRLVRARALTQRAVESALRNGAKETAATYEAESALREAEFGNQDHARAAVGATTKLALNRDVQAMAALALARAGDITGAKRLAAELNKNYRDDTLVQSYWLPTIGASIELERKDPSKAIKLLEAASSYELSLPTQNTTVCLYPIHVRSQAFLMLHNGRAAASEFDKILHQRGLVLNFPLGALAHLGLARSYVLEGDRVKARTAYQDFLALWKDADPDIPILKQAKAEYAKLQRKGQAGT
jgi:hypothetical protein